MDQHSAPQSPSEEVSAAVELAAGAPGRDQVEALEELARAAEEADGNPPFSEQTLVELHKAADSGDPQSSLRIAYAWTDSGAAEAQDVPGEQNLLAGAGVVVIGEEGGQDVLELVVRPNCRQHGIGGQLAEALADEVFDPAVAAGRTLRAWAHGEHDAAGRLATRFEWASVRELWRMRLTTLEDLPAAELPGDVILRTFRPGSDEEAWLKANAAAFAGHPEQGRLTMEDLRSRMEEDWFDPEGFLLAWDADGAQEQLLGFHWTKVHPAETDSEGGDGEGTRPSGRSEDLGEVYVVGVVPDAQGRGLGKALTLAGIEHLRAQGLGAIMLYVDSENTAAVELYRRLGFTRWDVDTMYAPIVEPAAEPAG